MTASMMLMAAANKAGATTSTMSVSVAATSGDINMTTLEGTMTLSGYAVAANYANGAIVASKGPTFTGSLVNAAENNYLVVPTVSWTDATSGTASGDNGTLTRSWSTTGAAQGGLSYSVAVNTVAHKVYVWAMAIDWAGGNGLDAYRLARGRLGFSQDRHQRIRIRRGEQDVLVRDRRDSRQCHDADLHDLQRRTHRHTRRCLRTRVRNMGLLCRLLITRRPAVFGNSVTVGSSLITIGGATVTIG